MDEKNVTMITVIHLIGFQTSQSITFLVFFLFLMIYCVTICGNLLIITLVFYSKALHSPMYFFLSQLSISDIILTMDILPNMLNSLIANTTIISLPDCITQLYFFASAETLQSPLLTVMSFDRYLAICKPLHYKLLMSHRFCWIIIITCWTLSFLSVFIYTTTISKLRFCGPNVVDHFFCDLDPILGLPCSDTTLVRVETTSMSVMFAIVPFFVITLSYVYIIITILEIQSITGRQKAFSTCSSHLTVVAIFYGTNVGVYLVPSRGQSWNISKFLSLLYTVVTPLLNPIIYSLRNEDIKQVVGKIINSINLSFHFNFIVLNIGNNFRQ
ncbi:PREDICTED: olfactory receptor 472-like [Nanorana parkeri]|uniref:olfactory receptor 472-like n=1 Tax=Nanorana parkeri TaxID=125878 RepID=UPI0008547554|nr:PREDICTED: olfactory receptor 472-like [Nanorana parkeri]